MRTQEEIDALLDKVENLLSEFDSAKDKFDRGEFAARNGERLSKYNDAIRAMNGKEDFDLVNEAYNELHNDFSDMPEEDYINQLVENIDSQLDKLRNVLGEETVEVESNDEGTEVVSHEDTGIEANAPEPENTETKDETTDEMTSSENAKTRYQNRSASNKEKLKGWDPQKGLLRSDEECKEKAEETIKDVAKEALPEGAELAVEVATAKPEDVKPEEKDEKDDEKEFQKELDKFMEAYTFGRK